MRVRRCSVLFVDLREELKFDLDSILSGGDGLKRDLSLVALAPHLGSEVVIESADVSRLQNLSPTSWVDLDAFAEQERDAYMRLRALGLVVSDGGETQVARQDEAVRNAHWHPVASVLHAFTRWSRVDGVKNMVDSGTETALGMRDVLGVPPVEAFRTSDASIQTLPRIEPSAFDDLLARRATCRNFDTTRKVPLTLFAQMLQRVFAAQAEVRITGDTVFLKKNAPSGGGLHPIEAYLMVQHVEGVEPGLYHYQPQDHALSRLPNPDKPLRDFMLDMVAQQHWFADAHVMVLLAPRFDRTFWKYRQHAKGYRVVALEAGHLSQTLYLSATEAGLGAFITAAVNEVELEQAFGLNHVSQGALAMCGFGWRADAMENPEFDPNGRVWGTQTVEHAG